MGNGYGRGTFIETKMILSETYLSLSATAKDLLNMLLAKRQFGNVKNRKGQNEKVRTDDNEFTLTYKEIMSHGYRINKQGTRVKGAITQPRATRGFDELLEKGFIEIVDQGGTYDKHKSKYGLVDDWMSWKVGDSPIRVRKKDCKRGYQGQMLGAVKKITAHTSAGHSHTHQRCTHQGETHT